MCLCMVELKRGITPGSEDLERGGATLVRPQGLEHRPKLQQNGRIPIAASGPPTASRGVEIVSSERTVPSTLPYCLPGSAGTAVHREGCPRGGQCSL